MGYFFHSTTAVSSFVIAGTTISMSANNMRFGFIKISTSTGSIVPDKIYTGSLDAVYAQGIANEVAIDTDDTVYLAGQVLAASSALLVYKLKKDFTTRTARKHILLA